MTPALTVLRNARTRLAQPGQWTSGAAGRNGHGLPVSPLSATAESWDLSGALRIEAAIAGGGLLEAARYIRACLGHDRSVGRFNDREGQTAVLGLLDSAIDLAARNVPLKEEA